MRVTVPVEATPRASTGTRSAGFRTGLANASFFALLAGRSMLRLPLYLVCGAAVGALAQPLSVLALETGSSAMQIGEVSLPLVSLAVWLALGVARALGL